MGRLPSRKLCRDVFREDQVMEPSFRLVLDRNSGRQIAEERCFVLWPEGSSESVGQDGLLCVVSSCLNPGCDCSNASVELFGLGPGVVEVGGDAEGLWTSTVLGAPGEPLDGAPLLRLNVDPSTGEVWTSPDQAVPVDPVMIQRLDAALDGVLLDAVERFRRRADDEPFEEPAEEINVSSVRRLHLASFIELYDHCRFDEYLLDGRRYIASLMVCPDPQCRCGDVIVIFADESPEVTPGDIVGLMYLALGPESGVEVVDRRLDVGSDALLTTLWEAFSRRHAVETYLRRREAQAKAVGATFWLTRKSPIRNGPKVGRNDPCPCGSGVKFKKCCEKGSRLSSGGG